MADILAEGVMTTAAAAHWLNKRIEGGRYGPSAIWRKMVHGSIAADGTRVWLEHIRIGRRKFLTSGRAIARFAARMACMPSDKPSDPANAVADLRASGFLD
jgi:hypothetical protein